jgi:hypothetical protein
MALLKKYVCDRKEACLRAASTGHRLYLLLRIGLTDELFVVIYLFVLKTCANCTRVFLPS